MIESTQHGGSQDDLQLDDVLVTCPDAPVSNPWRNSTIVVTSSGHSAGLANYEVKQTTTVNHRTLKLSSALERSHKGSSRSIPNTGPPSLDDRAAVGLLTRNIVIEAEGGSSLRYH